MAEKTLQVRWIVATHVQLDGEIRKRAPGDVDYLPAGMAHALVKTGQVVRDDSEEQAMPEDAEPILEESDPQLDSEGDDEYSGLSDS